MVSSARDFCLNIQFSTAKLNPQLLPFCLAMPPVGVFIPIILNNTRSLSLVQYSVSPLADRGPRDYVNITSRELGKMQSAAANLFAGQARLPGSRKEDDDDEYDDEDIVEEGAQRQQTIVVGNPSRPLLILEKTQSIVYIRVTRPGVIRLEHVLDSTNSDVHISRRIRSETTVVECPTVRFEDDGLAKVQCAGAARDVHIDVRGTVPMSLKWHRDIAGKREDFLVEGIEGTAEVRHVYFQHLPMNAIVTPLFSGRWASPCTRRPNSTHFASRHPWTSHIFSGFVDGRWGKYG
jgi:nucleoporin POM152